MNKWNADSSKMPGLPAPRPERPRRNVPARPVAPVVRPHTRLGWSRTVISGAWEPAAPMEGVAFIPNVRSSAALRARAGEVYRPPQPAVQAPQATRPPAPLPPAPVTAAIATADWERPITPLQESFFRSIWETVRQYIPRLPQISE